MTEVEVREWDPSWRPGDTVGPVVFRDARRHIVPDWSMERLLAICPDELVPVRSGAKTESVPLATAVRRMAERRPTADRGFDGDAAYIADWDFSNVPELRDDYVLPPFARGDPILKIPLERRPRLIWGYYGHTHSGTPLHQDVVGFHAWSLVISGRKEWIFFPPESDFGPDPASRNVFGPDAEADDERAGRTRVRAVVKAGDLIFVPSKWWHQVRNFGPTLALGSNFVSRDIAVRVLGECERLGYRHISHQLVESYGQELLEEAGEAA